MRLEVEIVKDLPRFAVNVSLACGDGELLALVGPSGSGKTTLMRTIAGLAKADVGRIAYNGDTWLDTRAGIDLPPRNRRLGYVFQEYTLFPHLTVFRNVAFATGDAGWVEELLRRFEVHHLKDRKPRKLSGGERQRVALAQALAAKPKVLLLDEPFSALDTVTRKKLRLELKKIKRDFKLPIIHITHDLEEAAELADSVLPMVEGRIERSWLTAQGLGPKRWETDRPGKIVSFPAAADRRKCGG